MNLYWPTLIVVVVAGLAVAAMLVTRRRAPEGSYFVDGDPAARGFGGLATGFAILAGFVVVLAFESYDASRSGAQTEARTVWHQFETVQLLPESARPRMSGELVCYARSVIHQEWPQMRSGTLSSAPNQWGVKLFEGLRSTEPR